MAVRRATHAHSWYTGDPKALERELGEFMAAERPRKTANLKAIISPHAGYRYCGPTASHGFGAIDPEKVSKVFVLGPSHHVNLRTAAIPAPEVRAYATPFGDLPLGKQILQDLVKKAAERGVGHIFADFALRNDEKEHSIEMQLPFLTYAMRGKPFTLVPIVCGAMSPQDERSLGELLAPYFDEPSCLFVISSDFCHWGERFHYTTLRPLQSANGSPLVHSPAKLPINAGIELLDRAGMNLIESRDVNRFREYLYDEQNTICGRHPICVLLEILAACKTRTAVNFVHYSHSSPMPARPCCDDSCVAYASGLVTCSA